MTRRNRWLFCFSLMLLTGLLLGCVDLEGWEWPDGPYVQYRVEFRDSIPDGYTHIQYLQAGVMHFDSNTFPDGTPWWRGHYATAGDSLYLYCATEDSASLIRACLKPDHSYIWCYSQWGMEAEISYRLPL